MGRASRRKRDRTREPRQEPLKAAPAPPGAARPARRLAPSPVLQQLRRRAQSEREAAGYTGFVVAQARAEGHSWREIGEAFHITGEGARRRWAHLVDQ